MREAPNVGVVQDHSDHSIPANSREMAPSRLTIKFVSQIVKSLTWPTPPIQSLIRLFRANLCNHNNLQRAIHNTLPFCLRRSNGDPRGRSAPSVRGNCPSTPATISRRVGPVIDQDAGGTPPKDIARRDPKFSALWDLQPCLRARLFLGQEENTRALKKDAFLGF